METEPEIIKEEFADELYERKSFKVDPGQEPMRIDKWVQHRIENASRNKIQQAIEAGFLTVNGKQVKSNYKIKPADENPLDEFCEPGIHGSKTGKYSFEYRV
jgi:23S rRNA pseudouridine1911/1915/1917 synthase